MEILNEIRGFLPCVTPRTWVKAALENLPVLLIDHAHCEKKAAASAMTLISRYPDEPELLNRMSRIVREEMIHFEQVLALMAEREVRYRHLSPSRYARELHQHIRTAEPARRMDTLIVGALIEARSCERFAALAPHLEDQPLARFYRSLFKAEGRHYQDYLTLARQGAPEPIEPRIAFFVEQERVLIESPDPRFRFHSGAPA